jgi:hypothetical protein
MDTSAIPSVIIPHSITKKKKDMDEFLSWIMVELLLIGAGDHLSEIHVLKEIKKIIKEDEIEEITFTHSGDSASDTVILTTNRIDLQEIIISYTLAQKLELFASAIRRPGRNSPYIKERQIFADIIHDLGITPAEFATDVHDFMIDHDILVYSTIKYPNKSRGGWSCIIQLKLTYDIQKVKEKFSDGLVTLYNGEK